MMICVAACLFLAIGCDDDDEDKLEPQTSPTKFQITATVPTDGQYNVTLSSSILIHFPFAIDDESVEGKITVTCNSGDAPEYSTDIQTQSIVLNPKYIWKERSDYTVEVAKGIRSTEGHVATEDRTIHFSTGVRRPKAGEDLSVVHVNPGPDEPCWDFHTFRVYFNEPILRTSLEYGKSVLFSKKDTGEVIPGNLFARSNQIVFDPDEDLDAGGTYVLTVTTDLRDYQETGMAQDYSVEFVPQSTGTRVELAMDKCPTIVEGHCFYGAVADDELPNSKFIDRNLNSMFADSIMLGPTNIRVGSRLWNEFADPKISPDRVPFVVRKGQKLTSPGIASLVGGEIPTGVDSGQVTITVMTDTVGELVGSEFVHGVPGLPAVIKLTMDASFSMEDGAAVAIIGQPVLGSTLTGHATVSKIENTENYETMEIEVVGFSEIELVNEYVPVTMTLRMVPPPNKPEHEYDETPPTLLSVSPADIEVSPEDITEDVVTRFSCDDIIAVFDEPIDPDGIEQNIIIEGPDGQLTGSYELYNPRVIFHPDAPMEPNTEYKVTVKTGVKDISGNAPAKERRIYFTTMPRQSSDEDPGLLAASSPGQYEDARLPANFFPELYFTQVMDRDSFEYGETFGLYDDTEGGQLVDATPIYYGLFVRIAPDVLLTPGHDYRVKLTQDVVNLDGLALDTDEDRTPGGPDIEIPFMAVKYSEAIQSVFITYPYADADVDGYINDGEFGISTNYMEMDFALISEPSYVMGYMPITIYKLTHNIAGDPILPIDIEPASVIHASSVAMDLFKVDGPSLLEMGRISIDLLYPSSADVFMSPDDGLTGVDADTTMLFNMENTLLNQIVDHNAYFKIPSKLRFSKDGRMIVLIRGMTSISMTIPGLDPIVIPVFTHMTTSTPPSRRGF